MKKIMLTMAMLMTIAISATAMTYREARNYARVMTDRMAVELRLTNRQYREVYDINYLYVNNPVRKDRALSRVLTPRQFERYMRMHHAPVAVYHPVPVKHHPVAKPKHGHKAHAHRPGVYTGW